METEQPSWGGPWFWDFGAAYRLCRELRGRGSWSQCGWSASLWCRCFFWVILIPVSNPSSTPHPTSNVVPFLGWVDVHYISPGKAFTTHIHLHPGNRHRNSKGNSNSNFKRMIICHPNILSRSWFWLFTKRSTSLEDPGFLPWHSVRLMWGLSAGSRAVQDSTVCQMAAINSPQKLGENIWLEFATSCDIHPFFWLLGKSSRSIHFKHCFGICGNYSNSEHE